MTNIDDYIADIWVLIPEASQWNSTCGILRGRFMDNSKIGLLYSSTPDQVEAKRLS